VVVECQPFLSFFGVDEGREVDALARCGLDDEHGDNALTGHAVLGRNARDPADVLAQRHRTSLDSPCGSRVRAHALRPPRANLRPLLGVALARPGPALAPLSRL